jgi:hypothetical protein
VLGLKYLSKRAKQAQAIAGSTYAVGWYLLRKHEQRIVSLCFQFARRTKIANSSAECSAIFGFRGIPHTIGRLRTRDDAIFTCKTESDFITFSCRLGTPPRGRESLHFAMSRLTMASEDSGPSVPFL